MATVQIRGVEEVRAQLEQLRLWTKTPVILLDVSQLSAKKLEWLQRDDRDFLDPGGRMLPELVAAAKKGVRQALLRGELTEERMKIPWQLLGEAARDRVAKRLLGGGNDIRGLMRKNVKSTIDRKGHGIIGYDSGDLWRDVSTAAVKVRFAGGGADLSLVRAAASGSSISRAVAGIRAPSAEGRAYAQGLRRGLRVALRAA